MAAMMRWIAVSVSFLLLALTFRASPAANDPSAPVYKPPLRGAPASRVGGGTRGAGLAPPTVAVLAPDHVGWSANPQPTLYWFLSRQVPVQIELTLLDERGTEPVIEKSFPAPAATGIQALSLSDAGVTLKPGQEYRWHVALVLDAKQRSSDVIASGTIRVMPVPDSLKAKLAKTDASEQPAIYAEEGFWYDSLDALMRLIRAAPDDQQLRTALASLLRQVGLHEVVNAKQARS